jgi:hypothetical protein
MLISDEYRALNLRLHEKGSYGRRGDKWAQRVTELIERFGPATALDYGCGQGALGRAIDFPIAEYDPAIPGKDCLPEPADLVICTDVIEHVEPELLLNVLDHLQLLTRHVLFAVVSTRAAKKELEDGRNAHLIVEGSDFWKPLLEERFDVLGWEVLGDEIAATLVLKVR